MKIIYLVDQLNKCGGLERVLSQKVSYLAENYQDIEIYIFTNEQANKPCFFKIPENVKCIDLDVNYNKTVSLYSFENIKKAISHFIKLRKAINNYNPDVVVHCGYGYDFYFLPFICKFKNTKLIKENHSSRYMDIKSKKGLRFFFEEKYNANVFLSNEELKLSKLANATIIPNPVKGKAYNLTASKKKIVIAAGRIAPVKGFDNLIKAWGMAGLGRSKWQLHIYGTDDTGETKKELLSLIDSLDLNDSVFLFSSIKNIEEKISEAGVYAMTSKTECFPMVLLEAMQYGTPIIAFDCPTGPRNIIKPESGILIENNNLESFANGLKTLVTNKQLRVDLSNSAYKHLGGFSMESVMQKWLKLFGYYND